MNSTGRTTTILMVAVVVLVVSLVAAGLLMQLSRRAAYETVEQLGDLMAEHSTARASLNDMETAHDNYFITGNDEQLNEYYTAGEQANSMWPRLTALATMIDERAGPAEPLVAPSVERLRSTVEQWRQNAADPEVALLRTGNRAEALAQVASGRGKQLFDEVQLANIEMDQQISNRLGHYSSELSDTSTLHLWLLIGLSGVTLLVTGVALRAVRRQGILQEQATQAAEAEQAHLKTIIENLPVAVRLLSFPDRDVILENRVAERLFPRDLWNSTPPDERASVFGLYSPDGRPLSAADSPVNRVFREGVPLVDYEIRLMRPDIGTVDVVASIAPLYDEHGGIIAAVVVMQDITRMKEMDERKDEFIATAAHELRNPLAALSGHSQLLKRILARSEVPPGFSEHVDQINRQVTRLDTLVERLLDASRLQLGRLVLTRMPADLVEIVRNVAADAQAAGEGAERVRVEAEVEALPGMWDPTRIEQVLSNLVTNALRHTPPGTEVVVRLCHEDGVAKASVIDRGPGVPEDYQARLFERYYGSVVTGGEEDEGGNNGRKRQGLGLGLYISNEIVKAHGGRIGYTPNPEGGSIFWFTLPLQPD